MKNNYSKSWQIIVLSLCNMFLLISYMPSVYSAGCDQIAQGGFLCPTDPPPPYNGSCDGSVCVGDPPECSGGTRYQSIKENINRCVSYNNPDLRCTETGVQICYKIYQCTCKQFTGTPYLCVLGNQVGTGETANRITENCTGGG